jgi:deferrochelatase/peroxidase EfeB
MSDRPVSRRHFLTGLGVTGLGAAALGTAGVAGVGTLAACSTDDDSQVVPFRGVHQAGVTTAQQEHLHIVAFTVLTEDRDELRDMLSTWTSMAERLTTGEQTTEGGALTDSDADITDDPDNLLNQVPEDTGEALDLASGNLTVTVGFGPSLFDYRFGLKDRKPEELEPLPKFPGDQLQDALCDGDIVIQACADDPQVAVHAVRNLTRAGTGVVAVKWSQLGYGAASKTTKEEDTPRNLFGFKDGTRNITADETDDIEKMVWVSDDGWMTGGTYMCVRRIRMLLEVWDRQILDDQQHTFARYKGSGAPIGTDDENADVPFDLYLGTGGPAIPEDSHVFLAHPDQNDGQRMLRRAYNFIEGSDSMGHLSAGLYFIAYVSAPSVNFTPIQMRLSHSDKMNEYVRYESKAIFACPPGLAEGEDWGTALFG